MAFICLNSSISAQNVPKWYHFITKNRNYCDEVLPFWQIFMQNVQKHYCFGKWMIYIMLKVTTEGEWRNILIFRLLKCPWDLFLGLLFSFALGGGVGTFIILKIWCCVCSIMCNESFLRDIFLITLIGMVHETFFLTNTFPTYEQMPNQSLFAGHHLLALWVHERGVIIMFLCHMECCCRKSKCILHAHASPFCAPDFIICSKSLTTMALISW